jgi:hypothetical protein
MSGIINQVGARSGVVGHHLLDSAYLNGVTTYNDMASYQISFAAALNSTQTFDWTMVDVNFFYVVCGMGYYPAGSYTASLVGWHAFRTDVGVGGVTVVTQTSSNSGSWGVSNTSSTNLRITKNAGTSSAYARGIVQVFYRAT